MASICGARVLNGEGFGGERDSGEGALRVIPVRGGGSIAAADVGCANGVVEDLSDVGLLMIWGTGAC